MINKKYVFVGLSVLAILPVYAASLLQPTSFPKTFNDVPFDNRMAVLAADYANFDSVYDENGNCISGCPYIGITLKQEQQDVQEATEYFADVVDDVVNQSGNGAVPYEPAPVFPNPTNTGGYGGGTTGGGTTITKNSIPLRSPVDKDSIIITSDFYFRTTKGLTGFHGAVDIGVPYETPVVATADGVVEISAPNHTYNGPYIKINHAKGFSSWYLHLSRRDVKPGDKVQAGQIIGLSGGAGARSTGAHLDYRISWNGKGRDVWIDILCPCRGTGKTNDMNKSKSAANNFDIADYTGTGTKCPHSAFWRDNYYRFSSPQTKQKGAQWRIKAGHCMTKTTDKLPDEI